jgi:hypothetical protein
MAFGLEIILAETVISLIKHTFRALRARNYLDENFSLPSEVQAQFQTALEQGLKAFLKSILNSNKLQAPDAQILKKYFEEDKIANEFSKLLDPGNELFDEFGLTDDLIKALGARITRDEFSEAWRHFHRAFSFSSRSRPELREFIRASYEAGSFKAISNFRDTMSRIESELEALLKQEGKLDSSIDEYTEELREYRSWAKMTINKGTVQ